MCPSRTHGVSRKFKYHTQIPNIVNNLSEKVEYEKHYCTISTGHAIIFMRKIQRRRRGGKEITVDTELREFIRLLERHPELCPVLQQILEPQKPQPEEPEAQPYKD